MKKAIVSIFALFGFVLALLVGAGSAAQATVPPSNCVNHPVGLVNTVVCQIDVNDNSVLDGNDILVTVLHNSVLSNNDIDVLTHALDDLDEINILVLEDVTLVKDTVVNVYDLIDIVIAPSVVIVAPCGCGH